MYQNNWKKCAFALNLQANFPFLLMNDLCVMTLKKTERIYFVWLPAFVMISSSCLILMNRKKIRSWTFFSYFLVFFQWMFNYRQKNCKMIKIKWKNILFAVLIAISIWIYYLSSPLIPIVTEILWKVCILLSSSTKSIFTSLFITTTVVFQWLCKISSMDFHRQILKVQKRGRIVNKILALILVNNEFMIIYCTHFLKQVKSHYLHVLRVLFLVVILQVFV